MAVATIERVDTDRVALAAGQPPDREQERVPITQALDLIRRLRPNLGAVDIDAVPDDVPFGEGGQTIVTLEPSVAVTSTGPTASGAPRPLQRQDRSEFRSRAW